MLIVKVFICLFCILNWVNDTLQLKDNSIVVIENKIIFPTFVEVYNLEIEDNENYYVTEEEVLVHNGYKDELKTRNKELINLYKLLLIIAIIEVQS